MIAPDRPQLFADTGIASRPPSRVHHRRITVDGLEIFYREAGRKGAPTVLLLHGFPSSSHMFRNLIPLLADRFHVVAPDYPGFGYSSAPATDDWTYSFDHLADVVERFVETVGLGSYAIYMQDYGGPVGLRLATRHPERVTAIVNQNANVCLEGISPAFDGLLRPLWERRSAETEAPVLKVFEIEGTKWQYTEGVSEPERLSPDAWTHDQKGLDRPGNFQIQLELQADYKSNLARYPEFQDYLRKHQPPVLVTWGRGDPFFLPANIDWLEANLTDVEVHVFEDTGHFALETHTQEIAAYMQEFLGTRLAPDVAA